VSAITEAVEGTYPTAQLLAKRQFPRSHDSMSELRQSLSEELTDRQQAVLEAAYHRGYFEWPRDASGEAVADSLGIAPRRSLSTSGRPKRRWSNRCFRLLRSPTVTIVATETNYTLIATPLFDRVCSDVQWLL